MKKSSVEFEKLVQKMQQLLAPEARVTHNVRLKGRHSGTYRQIDVEVRHKIGQYEIVVVIDCKDQQRPVSVKQVEEFLGLVNDVGAQKGVLFCSAGYTKAAKTLAKAHAVELYSPVDAGDHKWHTRFTMLGVATTLRPIYAFKVFNSTGTEINVDPTFYVEDIFDSQGTCLGSIAKAAVDHWNSNSESYKDGTYFAEIFRDQDAQFPNPDGASVPMQVRVKLLVVKEVIEFEIPINGTGVFDHLRMGILTADGSDFEVNFERMYKDGRKINSIEEASRPPLMKLDIIQKLGLPTKDQLAILASQGLALMQEDRFRAAHGLPQDDGRSEPWSSG